MADPGTGPQPCWDESNPPPPPPSLWFTLFHAYTLLWFSQRPWVIGHFSKREITPVITWEGGPEQHYLFSFSKHGFSISWGAHRELPPTQVDTGEHTHCSGDERREQGGRVWGGGVPEDFLGDVWGLGFEGWVWSPCSQKGIPAEGTACTKLCFVELENVGYESINWEEAGWVDRDGVAGFGWFPPGHREPPKVSGWKKAPCAFAQCFSHILLGLTWVFCWNADTDSPCLGWGLALYVSSKFQGYANAAGPWNTLETERL